jgi:hypothetical protein
LHEPDLIVRTRKFSELDMFGNADRRRGSAPIAAAVLASGGQKALDAPVARNALLTVIAAVTVLESSPAQAQFACVASGLNQTCANTGASGSFTLTTAAGGSATTINSGTVTGVLTTSNTLGGDATSTNSGTITANEIITGTGGNATGTNSGSVGSLLVEGVGASLNATGTNNGTVTGGVQVLNNGSGNATGVNTATVGGGFVIDTLLGAGNATGTMTATGSVGQSFHIFTSGGGNALATTSGTIGQFLKVETNAGGNATATNAANIAQYMLVQTNAGGDAAGTNSGILQQNFTVQTFAGGNAVATNSGTVAQFFQVQSLNGDATGTNSGITQSITVQTTNGAATLTNTGTVNQNAILKSTGGNVTGTNSGHISQDFQVTALAGGNVISANSGTIGGFWTTGTHGGSVTGTNSGVVNGGVVFSSLFGSGNVTATNSGTFNHGVQISTASNAATASLTNSGTIIGVGATPAIAFGGPGANTLTLLQGSSITGNIQLGSGGNNVVNVDAGGPIAGNIVGAGVGNTLNFAVGPGTFTYGAGFGFSGFNQVNLSSGTVILNGINAATNIAVTGGNLQVGDAADPTASLTGAVNVTGGTLSGHGTVVGNVNIGNGATLAPGGSVGTLTVQGNLALATAAIYMVDVSSSGASSTAVSGTAALGGTVQVFSSSNSFRFNSPYTILTSAGLGGTRFNGVEPMAGITEALSYTGTNVQLTLASALGQLTGLNANQRAVAATLDTAFNMGGFSGPLGTIFNGNIPLNLTQASGELGTGSQQTTFDAMNMFLGVMTDPFIAGRGDGVTGSAGAPGYAEENDSASAYAANGKTRNQSERDAYGMMTKAAPMANTFTQRWSVWAAGFGGAQSTDGNAATGSNSVTSRIAGTAVGADYRFSPFTIAGFALAGGGTSFSLANALGAGHSDLFQAGAYVRHVVGPAYISAALAYGWQDVTTDRTVTIAGADRLHAEFNANAFSGRAEGGYRFATPWMGVTPYAAGQFTTFDLPAYAESALSGANAFALAYNARSVTDTRSELGIRTDKSFALANGILTLRSRFAWAHDFDPDRNIAATFQALPAASFVVNGAAQAKDSALTTLAAEMKWMNGWSAAATFEGEFSDVTRSYAGKGVVRYQW